MRPKETSPKTSAGATPALSVGDKDKSIQEKIEEAMEPAFNEMGGTFI